MLHVVRGGVIVGRNFTLFNNEHALIVDESGQQIDRLKRSA